MKEVGYSICLSDAANAIQTTANHVTEKKGGEGVIREVLDILTNF